MARTAGVARRPAPDRPTDCGASCSTALPTATSPTTVPLSVLAPPTNSTSGAPTLTCSPTCAHRRAISPARGEGTSTTALSVSTEASGWPSTT